MEPATRPSQTPNQDTTDNTAAWQAWRNDP